MHAVPHSQGMTRRIVVLTNTSAYPLVYGWDLGIYASHPPAVVGAGSAIQAGLTITPR